uniref:Uncharacterized protein n=1 Tax=Rhizophora mucronata TaxID=61149 RepID=A0A2P2N0J2_RHIMU
MVSSKKGLKHLFFFFMNWVIHFPFGFPIHSLFRTFPDFPFVHFHLRNLFTV